MEEKNQKLYVYENFLESIPSLIGTLYCENKRGKYYYSFEFEDEVINNPKFSVGILGSDLMFFKGRQYAKSEGRMFGIFEDSVPDRWGRTLINKKYKSDNFSEFDYLTKVSDITRMGALRFKFDKDKDFIDDSLYAVPPIRNLRELEDAASRIEDNSNDVFTIDILSPSSSLGGARPKATVIDENGVYYIAKFPSKHDTYDMCAFEYVMYMLMKKCNINVPEVKLYNFSKYGSTILVKRFDRAYDNKNNITNRCHVLSSMSALGKNDGDTASYLDIAYYIKNYSTKPENDLSELFSRIAFSIVVKNVDDHLRNHSFIYDGVTLSLSPMYDVNPSVYGKNLSLNIDEKTSILSPECLLSTSKYYGIDNDAASHIISDISNIVKSDFYEVCRKVGINSSQIDQFSSIFK